MSQYLRSAVAQLKSRSRLLSDSRGSATIEAAIMAPVILLLFMGFIDGSFILKNGLMMSNVSGQVARYATATENLEEGTYCTTTSGGCAGSPPMPQMQAFQARVHEKAQDIANSLISQEEIRIYDNTLSIETSFNRGSADPNNVVVTMSGNNKGFFSAFIFDNLTISATSKGTYSFN